MNNHIVNLAIWVFFFLIFSQEKSTVSPGSPASPASAASVAPFQSEADFSLVTLYVALFYFFIFFSLSLSLFRYRFFRE
jgi:hypothetical protein